MWGFAFRGRLRACKRLTIKRLYSSGGALCCEQPCSRGRRIIADDPARDTDSGLSLIAGAMIANRANSTRRLRD